MPDEHLIVVANGFRFAARLVTIIGANKSWMVFRGDSFFRLCLAIIHPIFSIKPTHPSLTLLHLLPAQVFNYPSDGILDVVASIAA